MILETLTAIEISELESRLMLAEKHRRDSIAIEPRLLRRLLDALLCFNDDEDDFDDFD